jgi:hypothetical protein
MHKAKGPAVAASVGPQMSGSGPQGPTGHRLVGNLCTRLRLPQCASATSRWLTAGRLKGTLLASWPFAHLESPER